MGRRKRKRRSSRAIRGNVSDCTSDDEFEAELSDEYHDATSDENDALTDSSNGETDDRFVSSSEGFEVEDDDDDEDEDFEGRDEVREVGKRPVTKKRSLKRMEDDVLGDVMEESTASDGFDDDSDEDFSPEEEVVKITSRKRAVSWIGNGRRRGRKKNDLRIADSVDEDDEEESVEGMEVGMEKGDSGIGGVKKRGRWRTLPSSDDEDDLDFIVEKRMPVRRGAVGRRKFSNARRRRRQGSDLSDSDWSNFESTASKEDVWYFPVMNANCKKKRTPRVSVREKGRGKEVKELEKQVCGICLSEEYKEVARGVLNSCTHFFCFACVLEWSKVESKCPVCKQRFTTITEEFESNGRLGQRPTVVEIPIRDQVYQPSEEELQSFLSSYIDVVCMECLEGGDEDLMLLCDLCDSPAHTYCVGLGREVPEEDWCCNRCRYADQQQLNSPFQHAEGGLMSNNGELLQQQYHERNARESIFSDGMPYVTSDGSAHLREIPEQLPSRESDPVLSPLVQVPPPRHR